MMKAMDVCVTYTVFGELLHKPVRNRQDSGLICEQNML